MKMTTATNRVWCGIVFTDKEWAEMQSGKASLRTTINNILECGLPLLEMLKENKTLTPAENAIMKRIEDLVQAAQDCPTVFAECSETMLIAFGFTRAA